MKQAPANLPKYEDLPPAEKLLTDQIGGAITRHPQYCGQIPMLRRMFILFPKIGDDYLKYHPDYQQAEKTATD